MKNLTLFILIVFAIFAFSTCKEEPPYINYEVSQTILDTSYIVSVIPTPQPKEILIEDVSGVGCVNCPQAAQIARDIIAANSGRVNTVTEYPNLTSLGILVKPVDQNPFQSRLDLRSDVAKDIANYVTVPASLPSGFINRKKYSGNLDWSQPKENWSGDVNSELLIATPLNIDLLQTYDPSTKKLSVTLTVTYTQAVSGLHYLSVMLLQDSIIDSQETRDANNNTIFDSVYTHQHVLMDMLTSHTGDLLNVDSTKTPLIAGRVFKKRFEKILDARTNSPSALPQPQWAPKHMKVLAFVSQDDKSKYILQSKEIEIQ